MTALQQLDAYGATTYLDGAGGQQTRQECAPEAFAALRVVLDVVDEMDRNDLFAAYAFRLRTTITTALEAS